MSLFVAEATIVVVATTYAIWDTDSHTTTDTNDHNTSTPAATSSTAIATPTCSAVSSTTTSTASTHCDDTSIVSFEWTSSVGLLYSCILLYIVISTATNAIAAWKFWTVWNAVYMERTQQQQQRTCTKRMNTTTTPCLTESIVGARNNNNNECPICWNATATTACVCQSCHQGFHKDCLQQWVTTSGTLSCPWCRGSILGDTALRKKKQWWGCW